MSRTVEILQTVLPVIIVIAIGMICRKRNIISRDGINTLKNVVVNITLPAVLLGAFASTSYFLRDILIPLIMYVVCIGAWLLGSLVMKKFHIGSKFLPFLTTGFEAGMLGYALFNMLYGTARTPEFAILDLGQVLFVFTLYKILLGRQINGKTQPGQLVKEMVFSPIIIAIFAGVIIGATGLYQALMPSGVTAIYDACTDFIGTPTSMIILLTIGYDLVFGDIPWKATLKAVVSRFVIMAVLGGVFFGVLRLLWPDLNLTGAIIIMFLLPPPFVLPVFADDAGQRVYLSSVLSIYTLVSVLGFTILAIAG